MIVLGADHVRQALPIAEAIAAMREAFSQLAAGRVVVPLRTAVPGREPGAVTLVMPGRADVPLGTGAKIVSVVPGNRARKLPLLHATVLLLDGDTGRPAALLEGRTLTAIRTGAASGLATDFLARRTATSVLVIGAGVQARAQLEAVCAVRRVTAVSIHSRTVTSAERLAAAVAGRGAVPANVSVATALDRAVKDADIICTATTSATPVLRAEWVSPGAHVNAIGSFTPQMRELDPALLGRARVVVDQRDAALAEAGEVIAARAAGLLRDEELTELGTVVAGGVVGRRSEREITVFKSVGLAVQDLVAGARAVERARALGIGEEVDL